MPSPGPSGSWNFLSKATSVYADVVYDSKSGRFAYGTIRSVCDTCFDPYGHDCRSSTQHMVDKKEVS
jgi:hypothetical protein